MKKSPRTPRSQVRSALRRYIWLRSRERYAALKRDGFACVECGVKKKDGAKLEVDHLDGIDMEKIIDYIFAHLIPPPERLETVCKRDHAERTQWRRAMEKDFVKIK